MDSLLGRIINLLLRRPSSVAQIVVEFDKTQAKLVGLSARLRDTARKAEERARILQEQATARQAEAERATTVADRISNLINPDKKDA